jgi:hypothetical protein
MAELHKRWGKQLRIGQAYGSKTDIYRWFLGSTVNTQDWESWERVYMACIESYSSPDGPFTLEIWNIVDEDWDLVGEFPTLKQAKTMGRLMAGLAITGGA